MIWFLKFFLETVEWISEVLAGGSFEALDVASQYAVTNWASGMMTIGLEVLRTVRRAKFFTVSSSALAGGPRG